MTDITVIVDRIAGMRVSQMNLELEAARQSVMESYAPGDDDLYMRTLEVAQIDGEDYFNHIVHKDIDKIVKDIQTAHTNDATTADERQETVAEVRQKFEKLVQTAGTQTAHRESFTLLTGTATLSSTTECTGPWLKPLIRLQFCTV